MRADPSPAVQDVGAVPIVVTCGKCGKTISTMVMLKPIKEVVRKHGGRCPSCGQVLSPSDFLIEAEEQ